jgi:NitT/TauT family transport system substrate-binding protein
MHRYNLSRRRFLNAAGAAVATSAAIGPRTVYGQASKVTLRLEWSITGIHAPWFVGLEKGTFAKAGVDLTVNPGRGSGLTVQAVAGGQETFGVVDSTIMPSATMRGADVRMFYGLIQRSPLAIMFFKDSGIKSPKDLEGKRYADMAGTTTNALAPVLMKAAGVDISKVKLLSVDPANKLRTFLDRQFEATACSVVDDFLTLRSQGHDIDAFPYPEFGLAILAQGLIATNGTLRGSANLVRNLVAGLAEAVKITGQDPAAAAQIVKKRVPESPDAAVQTVMINEMYKRLSTKNSEGKKSGFMAEADWRTTADALTQGGLVQTSVDIATLYTNDFLA